MRDALPRVRAISMDVLRAVNRGTYELSIPAISYVVRWGPEAEIMGSDWRRRGAIASHPRTERSS